MAREATDQEIADMLAAVERFEPVVVVRPCERCGSLTPVGVFCAECRRLRVVA